MGVDVVNSFIVATIKSWNLKNFQRISREIKADWHLITDKEALIYDKVRKLNPRYIFFPHWSWLIPEEIYTNYECIVFHMTDLPFGRGGSPLQNLIIRGITRTKVSAIKVVRELDAGPVYLKRDLTLKGSAERIFTRCSRIVFNMMRYIIENEPEPKEQKGRPVIFQRRTPAESRIPDTGDLDKIYDYIRMLDAEGYPRAFIETEKLRLEFSGASLESDHILADVKITPRLKKNES